MSSGNLVYLYPNTPEALSAAWPAKEHKECVIVGVDQNGVFNIFGTGENIERAAWVLQRGLHKIYRGEFHIFED